MNFIIEKKQWNILKARFSRAIEPVVAVSKLNLTLASQMISVEPFFRLDLETQRNE